MIRSFLLVFSIALVSSMQLMSQDYPMDSFGVNVIEPNRISKFALIPVAENMITTPPSSPVRAAAEWEEMQALTITWTYYNNNNIRNILVEIVRHAREEANVIIICSNAANVQSVLTAAGVDWSTNVTFLVGNYDSIWARDYGGNSVYTNDVDSLLMVDWLYNRPRPDDDAVPELIADYLNMPFYSTTTAPYDLVNTGGNYMSDGMGTAFCSELVIDENGANNQYGTSNQNESEIDAIMQQFMGIENYIKMTTLPYDDIHHIDMHMKLLDEETLLVAEYPTGIADGPQIEANIQYVLANFTTSFGNPYRVIRIPSPPDGTQYPNNGGDYRTYSNATFINKTVLVPFYVEQYDTVAQRIWEEALPGYQIVGINCNNIIGYLGAIHCITHEIGTNDPLLINHARLHNQPYGQTAGYQVVAKIKHRSGIAQATLFYRLHGDTNYQSVAMSPSDSDLWSGIIPEQIGGSRVEYYIGATAVSGKTQVRPMPAPEGYWPFSVDTLTVGTQELSTTWEPIFPNPCEAITCIPVHTTEASMGTIDITDMQGRLVQRVFEGRIPTGTSRYFFNAATMPSGVYTVSLTTQNGILTQKAIVK